MLFFIISGGAIVVGALCLIVSLTVNLSCDAEATFIGIGAMLLGAGLVVFISCLLVLPSVGGNERCLEQKIAEVNIYMESGKQIRSMDEYNMVFNAIVDINETIQKHKIYVNSPWQNVFHSKEIAEMEPYPYDGLKDPSTSFIINQEQ